MLFALILTSSCVSKEATDGSTSQVNIQLVSSKVMGDGRTWTTENLNIETVGSYCAPVDSPHCVQYGRLYTWSGAIAGCKSLGDSWHLPTNEEWQALAKAYGGVYDDSEDQGKAAYSGLVMGGTSGFAALLGGNLEPNGHYRRLGAHGFYWTATESDSAEAWFYNFGKGSELLNRHTGTKEQAVSVRCVK